MKYQPTWNSLSCHGVPQWFRDAKFGIYTHWGIYSVPACGPNVSLYFYNMYSKGTPQNEYHVQHFGGPEKFGYKDFIPMFKAERFDADEWAELFRQSGAQFAGPVAEHHDGFAMWDTKLCRWNAAVMGPKRDVVGELEKAIRGQGMRFLTAFHHAENWYAYPHWVKEYDTSDPQYADLYGEPHNTDWPGTDAVESWVPQIGAWFRMQRPSKAFLDRWLGKVKEVVDNYDPDMLWFDFGLDFIQEHYKQEMARYYYEHAAERGRETLIAYKDFGLLPGSGVVDLEQGRFSRLAYHEWITDTTVDDGCGWGYMNGAGYKTSASLIHYLADNVSKNGSMLLNVGPKSDGTIPDEAKQILKDMGAWLSVNGEAIFGTVPWMTFGEGPMKMQKTGSFTEDEELKYTARDFRFTVRGDALYAICLGWPKDEAVIATPVKSAATIYPSEIKSITMLGSQGELPWRFADDGLRVAVPAQKPCDHAYVFKITRKHPFQA